ncbi:hypothetical protein P7K49_005576 [Saguinus oedipus]|uniref:Uncharacterized protein n=1 Tax=Saguinus oedipus TaxID=9490 RepID=A0ABQ9W0R8_SAGOE|nr:hypothetical protein P7K49_005576 [Saguinus oedipus]
MLSHRGGAGVRVQGGRGGVHRCVRHFPSSPERRQAKGRAAQSTELAAAIVGPRRTSSFQALRSLARGSCQSSGRVANEQKYSPWQLRVGNRGADASQKVPGGRPGSGVSASRGAGPSRDNYNSRNARRRYLTERTRIQPLADCMERRVAEEFMFDEFSQLSLFCPTEAHTSFCVFFNADSNLLVSPLSVLVMDSPVPRATHHNQRQV